MALRRIWLYKYFLPIFDVVEKRRENQSFQRRQSDSPARKVRGRLTTDASPFKDGATTHMQQFSKTCERIAATTKKLEKTAIVAEYLKSRTLDEAAISSVFLSGRPFPIWEETTLQVGGSLLWHTVAELAGKNDKDLTAAYRKLGDLGAVAGEIL